MRAALGIGSGAALGVVAVATWYAVTPGMTVESMAAAAARGDTAAFVSHMDMPRLRSDMRRRATDALGRSTPPGLVILDPRAVTEALVGPVIDRTFSVEGTRRVLNRPGVGATAASVRYRIMRDGPNRFVARLDGPRRVDLLFSRHGLTWMMTGIAVRPAERRGAII